MVIKFPDLSHYKPGVPLAGVQALLTKATQGTSFIDTTYAGYKAAAAKAKIPFAAYHYLTTDDVTAQARHALAIVGKDTPLMVDVEAGSGTLPSLVAFIKAYRSLGGALTLVYLPHWYWQSIGSPSLAPLVALKVALISSSYQAYTDDGPGWRGYGGMTPRIWQYTNAGSLNGHSVDMNAFKGSVAELAALIEGDDMAAISEDDFSALIWRVKALLDMSPTVEGGVVKNEPVPLVVQVKALQAAVAKIPLTAQPAAPMSEADVTRIATAAADLIYARLKS